MKKVSGRRLCPTVKALMKLEIIHLYDEDDKKTLWHKTYAKLRSMYDGPLYFDKKEMILDEEVPDA